VETAVISYRVADFLKQHPPFNAIDGGDLLELSARGRVRFYEPNEYILWQGEPHRLQVFVIQQGTVSLWDESDEMARLRDVRGAGDMLGVERYNNAPSCLCSARSESDVVIYAFPQTDFDAFVMRNPFAAQYVAAEGRVTADYQPAEGRRDPQGTFLHALTGHARPFACSPQTSIADAARQMLDRQVEAIAIVDAQHRVQGVVTLDRLLGWIGSGGGNAQEAVTMLISPPVTVAPDTSVTDGVLAMESVGVTALTITSDGSTGGSLQALVTARDLAPIFGEQPSALLRGVRHATSTSELRALQQRARQFTLEYLTSASAVEWLARLMYLFDVAVVRQLLTRFNLADVPGCWCVSGAVGRGESLAGVVPQLLAIVPDAVEQGQAREMYRRVRDGLLECGYLPQLDAAYEDQFYVATVADWRARYHGWIHDPVRQQTYLARTLFDLRPVHGPQTLFHDIETVVAETVDRSFVHVLANDCLGNLPPLTFYQDAVVDSVGERHATFLLEQSALRPLVDVGRVFAMAAGQVLGRSTLDRLARARTLLPEHESVFRQASDTLKVVLWQQGRVGISEGTAGAELPPALLSRHDRHMLKGGFRALLQLIEFTGDRSWIDRL